MNEFFFPVPKMTKEVWDCRAAFQMKKNHCINFSSLTRLLVCKENEHFNLEIINKFSLLET